MVGIHSLFGSSSFSQPIETGRRRERGVIAAVIGVVMLITANAIERTSPGGALFMRATLGGVGLLWLLSKIFPSSEGEGSDHFPNVRVAYPTNRSSSLRVSATPLHQAPQSRNGWEITRDGFPAVFPVPTNRSSSLRGSETPLNRAPQSRNGRASTGDGFPAVISVPTNGRSSLRRNETPLNRAPQSRS